MVAQVTKVSFPARCAVAVICGEHLVSQVYPAAVPVEGFIDGVVDLLNDELKRRGEAGLDVSVAYELQRANGTRLDVTKTLDELGVEDGTTLVLAPASEGDAFEPQYESLSTGLARAGREIFAPVTAQTALRTASRILAMMAVTIAVLTVHIRFATESWIPAVVATGIGFVIVVGAIWVWRWWPDRPELLDGLGWAAVPLVVVGIASAAPGEPGAPHLFIAALVTAVLTWGVFAVTHRHCAIVSAVVTVATVTGAVAGLAMFVQPPMQRMGMGVLVGLLFLLTLAPTVALRAARITPPHFGSITGRDLFRRGDGIPVDAVVPVDDDADDLVDPDTTPSGAAVALAARRANGVLRGVCAAVSVILPVAVWATLTPGQPYGGTAALLAGLFVLIFISRARAFTDQRQAVALVCGAAAAVCAAVGRYVVGGTGPSSTALAYGALILSAFAAAALGAALLVPGTRFTPLVRMVTEWVELVAIVAALPLVAWISGLFVWVRMR